LGQVRRRGVPHLPGARADLRGDHGCQDRAHRARAAHAGRAGGEAAAMSAALLALGVSHKTAPVALRERLALPEGRAAAFLSELVSHDAVREAVAISTCNRT